ncbi:CCHC-type domain-containing protein [Fusarium keratoplasticum]|uniref:CCHC-type domain-containing protein n=1 Tax=Fusarium keratoplasticum TaxID=1328300 RepID=A0ACC0QC98_9HYPO|nr:CCHC-type domain-containing protein [Fusarium keratoplasticum]KAI8648664.1 CCHC-type domain-containing protein [Fusarium keratoplasticum]
MDATVEEILVEGGGSVAATRRSSRPAKPTAKLQENLQAAVRKTGTSKKAGSAQTREGENEFSDRAGASQTEGAASNNASLVQMMLRTMLQETSTHLMSEQKQMLERLWDALMENQRTATQMMSDQLEMIRQLQQEIQTIKMQAAEELNKAEEFRRMHEQTTRQLRIMREQTAEQLRAMREQAAKDLEQMRQQMMEQLEQARNQATEEMKQMRVQLNAMADGITSGAQASPQPSSAAHKIKQTAKQINQICQNLISNQTNGKHRI